MSRKKIILDYSRYSIIEERLRQVLTVVQPATPGQAGTGLCLYDEGYNDAVLAEEFSKTFECSLHNVTYVRVQKFGRVRVLKTRAEPTSDFEATQDRCDELEKTVANLALRLTNLETRYTALYKHLNNLCEGLGSPGLGDLFPSSRGTNGHAPAG